MGDTPWMWTLISLLVPMLIPSWRFFQTVEASPRIQVRTHQDGAWRALSPLPATVPLLSVVGRLFHNPQSAEHLFRVSLAERWDATSDPTVGQMLSAEVAKAVMQQDPAARMFQFRLCFIDSHGLQERFRAPMRPLS